MKCKIKIPSDANYIIHTLQNDGYSAYVVGGCVRDTILKHTPHDWDICTSAPPDKILEIFKNEKIIETGLQHGTVTIVLSGESYEVTTFRIDGNYTDNRRPDSVSFTDDLKEDLRRRDFTINAIAYNDKDGLIDPYDGISDIKNGIIRCVGSAKERFSEDALRILRAIRFASQLDFIIAPETMFEITEQYENLRNISIERINSEFCKMVISDSFCVQLVLYQDVFALFIPEFKDTFNFKQNNPYHSYDLFGHIIHSLERCTSDDLIVRLAVFFHDFGKPHSYQDGEDGIRHFKGHAKVGSEMTNTIMRRLKFDNDTREKVVELVYYHDSTFEVGKKYVKRWLNKIGETQFRRLLEVRKADIKGHKLYYDKARIDNIDKIFMLIEEVIKEDECFSLKDLNINGRDLIKIGYKSGKELGDTLNSLLKLVIDGEINNKKEELLVEAERRLRD